MTEATLFVTRGAPGSGKTTWARIICGIEPDRCIRVNRDDTRRDLFGSDNQDYYDCGKDELHRKETLITEANHHTITTALKAGFVVVCDDTNLPVKRVRDLRKLAVSAGAGFMVQDFSEIPLEICLERNAARTDKEPVPEEVIRGMYNRFIKGGLAPLVDETEDTSGTWVPVVNECLLDAAYIFDLDGTLALKGDRDIHDGSKVGLDTVNEEVLNMLLLARQAGYKILITTGRSEEFRAETEDWLNKNIIRYDEMFMRAEGDSRRDDQVKYELFDGNIRGEYDVLGVFDDRDQVVRMWRHIGLTCFQVAYGDF